MILVSFVIVSVVGLVVGWIVILIWWGKNLLDLLDFFNFRGWLIKLVIFGFFIGMVFIGLLFIEVNLVFFVGGFYLGLWFLMMFVFLVFFGFIVGVVIGVILGIK